jgi:myo-inositol catabolism protein IolC
MTVRRSRHHCLAARGGTVPGFIGFAVGGTSFWDALVALRDNKTTRDKAVETIANRYVESVRTFEDARKG